MGHRHYRRRRGRGRSPRRARGGAGGPRRPGPNQRRNKGLKGKRKLAVKMGRKRRVSFTERVRRALATASDRKSMMKVYVSSGVAGTGTRRAAQPAFATTDTLQELSEKRNGLSCVVPTGFSPWATSAVHREYMKHRGGMVMFPLSHFVVQADTVGEVAYGEEPHGDNALHYTGAGFNLDYLVFDYGWKELEHTCPADNSRPYHDCDITFGYVKNVKMVHEFLEGAGITWEVLLNWKIGEKGPRATDEVFAGASWPHRYVGTAFGEGFTDETKYRRRDKPTIQALKNIVILKKDSLRYRPVIAAEDGDGEEKMTEEQLGRLHGQGSFKFPQAALGRCRLADAFTTSAERHSGEQSLDRRHKFEGKIPFVFARGTAQPANPDGAMSYTAAGINTFCLAADDNGADSEQDAARGMGLCLRAKMAITDL